MKISGKKFLPNVDVESISRLLKPVRQEKNKRLKTRANTQICF